MSLPYDKLMKSYLTIFYSSYSTLENHKVNIICGRKILFSP